jgi:hypothetical protein
MRATQRKRTLMSDPPSARSGSLPEQTSSEIVFYQGEDGRSRIQVRLDDGTVWLTQRLLSDLFQKDVRTISEHIQNIFDDQELAPEATIRKFRIVQSEGNRDVSRLVDHYNLDVVLAVGYRVRSHRGTQFRRWATERLNEFLVKGFVLDDERLKEGRSLGNDYFKELLERIREIRASEKRFYQQIRDLYALAVDYDPSTPETKEFFQVVQNKLHWTITGSTAAEIVADRADASKPNMGLTTWKGAKVRKADVTVAKNYLNDDEIRQLNRIVTMYLDYAEEQAERRRPLYMRDWRDKLDGFLQFNERAVLKNAGKISAEVAQFEQKRISEEAAAPDAFDETAKRLASTSKSSKTKGKPE